jgi:signal transduction histidine kinase
MSDPQAASIDTGRDPPAKVREVAAKLASRQVYFSVLDAFPSAAFVLNGKRQLLYANKAAVEGYGLDLLAVMGRRPGETMACENSAKGSDGCGTAKACRVCGIYNAVQEALVSGKAARSEAQLTLGSPEDHRAIDLLVTATPLHDDTGDYFIVALEDRSDQKRKEVLERIFFHDVINSLSVIKSSAELLKLEPEEGDYVDYILKATSNLEEEILRQRDLRSMEKGELEVKPKLLSSLTFLHDLVVDYSLTEFARDRTFVVDREASMDLEFRSDAVLLRRVLGNMCKNALEATKPGEAVRAATREEGGAVLFEVRNPAFIPIDDQLRIFQRSFSTKGLGRGVGTYSMRLITENYLGGRIGFESSAGLGTRFWIRLPLVLEVVHSGLHNDAFIHRE